MSKTRFLFVALAICLASCNVHAQTSVTHIQPDGIPYASGVWAGDTLYLSGQIADPMVAADAAKATPAQYGDTKAQAASVFAKLEKLLRAQELELKDVVKLTVFLGPDPATGKLDYAGMQSIYLQYFGTQTQPLKPARSTIQAAALAQPWALIEVDAIAVRGNHSHKK